MSAKLKEIREQVMALPADERAELAVDLIQSLDTGHDEIAEELWVREAEQRYQTFKDGKLGAQEGADVFARARKKLKE